VTNSGTFYSVRRYFKPVTKYEGKSISKLQIVIEKEKSGDSDIHTTFIFQCNLHTNLHTCPTVSQALGNLRRKILVVAIGTPRTLLFQPRHREESDPPKDVALKGCLT
jgi:hypothetical protein